MNRFISLVVFCLLTFSPDILIAYSTDIGVRCDQEVVPEDRRDLVQGRNAWAFKCNYIDQEDLDYLNKKNMFMVYTKTIGNVNLDNECEYGLEMLTSCFAKGCFIPTQEVLFGEQQSISIEKAAQMNIGSLSALLHWPQPGVDTRLKAVDIDLFVKGETSEEILTITTKNGGSVAVTRDHRLVLDSGNVVRADEIVEGKSFLMTLLGSSQVVSVVKTHYSGYVWNVQPRSEESLDNINIADGILTGSLRYQSEWAKEDARMILRSVTDISKF